MIFCLQLDCASQNFVSISIKQPERKSMKLKKTLHQSIISSMALLAALLFAGCQSSQEPSGSKVTTGSAPSAPAATEAAASVAAAPAAAVPKTALPVHIKAGS